MVRENEELKKITIEDDFDITSSCGEITVYLDKIAQEHMKQISLEDTNRELGGILLGDYEETDEGHYKVYIFGAIKAEYTESSRANITFTHETWDYLDIKKENLYPNTKIVGWFHTHPGLGLFLSDYDLFIHNNFFNLPWQVAYVIDPVYDQECFYGWSKDKIIKLPFEQKTIILAYNNNLPGKAKEKIKKFRKRLLRYFIVGILCLAILGSAFIIYNLSEEIDKVSKDRDNVLHDLSIKTGTITGYETEVEGLKSELKQQEKHNEDLDKKLNDAEDKIEEYRTDLENLREELGESDSYYIGQIKGYEKNIQGKKDEIAQLQEDKSKVEKTVNNLQDELESYQRFINEKGLDEDFDSWNDM